MPSKAIVTQGAMMNEICVSLFVQKDWTVYVFKSDLSFDFQLVDKFMGVQSASEISFLKIGDANQILNSEISNTVGH